MEPAERIKGCLQDYMAGSFLPSDCRSSRGPIFGPIEPDDRLTSPAAAAALPDLVGALEEASSRQGSVVRTLGASGTSRPSIARSQDTRAGSNIVGFELTELSRIVLLQAIVPESSPSQASCQCVEIHNYIELRYKLC